MATAEQNRDLLVKMQETLDAMALANTTLVEQVNVLSRENLKIKNEAQAVVTRVEGNKVEWVNMNREAEELFEKMRRLKDELTTDGVTEDYFKAEFVLGKEGIVRGFEKMFEPEVIKPIKEEEPEAVAENLAPFTAVGREEKLDVSFGSTCTGRELRRFIDKYRVVKELNIAARLTGWDKPEYRANKLKLALEGEAFDYIGLENTMLKPWTSDDEEILDKLKDRYLKIQAVELNILEFEKSQQLHKEPLSEFLSRMQRLAADAYEGDSEAELQRKLAWRFVTGVRSDTIDES